MQCYNTMIQCTTLCIIILDTTRDPALMALSAIIFKSQLWPQIIQESNKTHLVVQESQFRSINALMTKII